MEDIGLPASAMQVKVALAAGPHTFIQELLLKAPRRIPWSQDTQLRPAAAKRTLCALA